LTTFVGTVEEIDEHHLVSDDGVEGHGEMRIIPVAKGALPEVASGHVDVA
jgi:hypothetical protein